MAQCRFCHIRNPSAPPEFPPQSLLWVVGQRFSSRLCPSEASASGVGASSLSQLIPRLSVGEAVDRVGALHFRVLAVGSARLFLGATSRDPYLATDMPGAAENDAAPGESAGEIRLSTCCQSPKRLFGRLRSLGRAQLTEKIRCSQEFKDHNRCANSTTKSAILSGTASSGPTRMCRTSSIGSRQVRR
eukprot:scaffold6247_cov256-Pinguiococcus_pyrenoidosus.AAC.2